MNLLDEDRPVRTARRYAIGAFVVTAAFVSMIPLGVLVLTLPGWRFAAPLLALLCAAIVLHCLRFRDYLRHPGQRASVPIVVMSSLVGAALCVIGQASTWGGWAWATVAALLLGDIVAGRSKRTITLLVTIAALLVFCADLLVAPRLPVIAAWIGPAIAAFYVATLWASNVERNWWLRSVVRIDDARRITAELATTRERLRLADDLHDILGHALEVVAFKSELAARTVPEGAERARDEMADAARVAREAMNQVRSLAEDRRPTNLASELAGARAVLDSAGVELLVRGDPALVAEPLQDVLGGALREAMTNLLRHSDAAHCTITLEQHALATLRVDDDGTGSAPSPEGSPAGSGLRGIERKLAPYAGTLTAGRRADGGFSLCVNVPVPGAKATVSA